MATEAPPEEGEEEEEEAAASGGSGGGGRARAVGPDGSTWWTSAMADLAARTGGPVTAGDMLRLCQSGSFDAGFLAFAKQALGLASDKEALEAVLGEAEAEIPELERIAEEEEEAAASGAAMEAKGIEVVALWICGACGNANPGCPYRATRSGGYKIFVPVDQAEFYPGYDDVAAAGLGPDLRDMCRANGFSSGYA